jgi:hypothetical protein
MLLVPLALCPLHLHTGSLIEEINPEGKKDPTCFNDHCSSENFVILLRNSLSQSLGAIIKTSNAICISI